MEANKDHISLETAKLLKDCGVESENLFIEYKNSFNIRNKTKLECLFLIHLSGTYNRVYPAYTWQEILWEHAEEFFGEDYVYCGGYSLPAFKEFPKDIILLLQQKKYKEADEYFRKNCIFI